MRPIPSIVPGTEALCLSILEGMVHSINFDYLTKSQLNHCSFRQAYNSIEYLKFAIRSAIGIVDKTELSADTTDYISGRRSSRQNHHRLVQLFRGFGMLFNQEPLAKSLDLAIVAK